MKRLIPFALLMCMFSSLSSFTVLPVKHVAVKNSAKLVVWPITGTTGSSKGTVNYSISGSGDVPNAITFSQGSTIYGTYLFTYEPIPGKYTAVGMKDILNISGVQMTIYSNGSYFLDIISIY